MYRGTSLDIRRVKAFLGDRQNNPCSPLPCVVVLIHLLHGRKPLPVPQTAYTFAIYIPTAAVDTSLVCASCWQYCFSHQCGYESNLKQSFPRYIVYRRNIVFVFVIDQVPRLQPAGDSSSWLICGDDDFN